MSAFLGPIHMWLYNQIQIVEKREAEIVKKFSEKYSETEVENIIFPYRYQYGQLKKDKPLAELITGNDIHPWLESAINSAQSREAAVIASLMDKYDDQELLFDIYSTQAEQLAEKEFKVHADIADRFGYKLSIHSGSDKFSVFPIIGRHTQGRVHVKTAGTNWLEAIRVVAENISSIFFILKYKSIGYMQQLSNFIDF